jgi:hypothetical protein
MVLREKRRERGLFGETCISKTCGIDSRHAAKKWQFKTGVVCEDNTVSSIRGPNAQETRTSFPVSILVIGSTTFDDAFHIQLLEGKLAVKPVENAGEFLQLVRVASNKCQSQTSATSTTST